MTEKLAALTKHIRKARARRRLTFFGGLGLLVTILTAQGVIVYRQHQYEERVAQIEQHSRDLDDWRRSMSAWEDEKAAEAKSREALLLTLADIRSQLEALNERIQP